MRYGTKSAGTQDIHIESAFGDRIYFALDRYLLFVSIADGLFIHVLLGEAFADNVALIILIYYVALENISHLEGEIAFFIGIFADLSISVELATEVYDQELIGNSNHRGFDNIAFLDFCCVLKGILEHAKIIFFQFFESSLAAGFTHLV